MEEMEEMESGGMAELFESHFWEKESVGLVEEIWSIQLLEAVKEGRYQTIYALLRRAKRQIYPLEAFALCQAALRKGLNTRAFLAILEHSPPLKKFLKKGGRTASRGLVEEAAARDRVDILDILLSRGGNVNRLCYEYSPLEAAMEGQALFSVERLLQEPDLDTALTSRLLHFWSHADSGMVLLDFCLQTAAPRLLGKEASALAPLPLPDQLTVLHAVWAENWNLLCRLCRERGQIPAKEGALALRAFPWGITFRLGESHEEERTACVAALCGLLTACPGLMRGRRACQLLVYYYLRFYEQEKDRLAPWLARIQRRQVPLREFPEAQTKKEIQETLRLWQEHLPRGPRPALDRHAKLHEFLLEDISPDELDLAFQTCVLTKRKPNPNPRIVSNLALSLLLYGRPQLVEEQLQPGGLLAGENPEALWAFCQVEEHPRLIRALLLAYMKKETSYEL